MPGSLSSGARAGKGPKVSLIPPIFSPKANLCLLVRLVYLILKPFPCHRPGEVVVATSRWKRGLVGLIALHVDFQKISLFLAQILFLTF